MDWDKVAELAESIADIPVQVALKRRTVETGRLDLIEDICDLLKLLQ